MARKLPWNAQRKADRLSQAKIESEPKKSTKDSPSSEDDLDRAEKPKFEKKSPGRNTSSSPPPAPPTEEFMIDGMDNDDGWMMVEDELLTTARLFTAHLHHAEYQRLKGLARSRLPDARPTVGGPSSASTALKKLAAGATAEVDELDDEELDPYNDDPLLAELMNAPEKLEDLIGGHGKAVNTGTEGAVRRQRMRLEPEAQNVPDIGPRAKTRNRAKSSNGPHEVLGSSDQQLVSGGPGIEPPKSSKGSLLPAKLASKLAKRKLNSKEDEGKEDRKVKLKDANISDVPTFLL